MHKGKKLAKFKGVEMEFYKTVEEFQKAVRKKGTTDFVKVGDVVYTMDNYDMSGKEITYGNKKKDMQLLVETEDRYKKGFGDAVVTKSKKGWYRTDMGYLE